MKHRPRYLRLRSVCCRFWPVTPWDFDAAVARGDVTFRDVAELFLQLAHDPLVAWWIFDYVCPEIKIRQENRAKKDKWRQQIERTVRMAMAQKAREKPITNSELRIPNEAAPAPPGCPMPPLLDKTPEQGTGAG